MEQRFIKIAAMTIEAVTNIPVSQTSGKFGQLQLKWVNDDQRNRLKIIQRKAYPYPLERCSEKMAFFPEGKT